MGGTVTLTVDGFLIILSVISGLGVLVGYAIGRADRRASHRQRSAK